MKLQMMQVPPGNFLYQRSARKRAQQGRITGFAIEGMNEPSNQLVDLCCKIYDVLYVIVDMRYWLYDIRYMLCDI